MSSNREIVRSDTRISETEQCEKSPSGKNDSIGASEKADVSKSGIACSFSSLPQSEDAEFVESVMKTNVTSVDIKDGTAGNHINSKNDLACDTVKEKRKRERSGQSESNDDNDKNKTARKKYKRSKLYAKGNIKSSSLEREDDAESFDSSDDEYGDSDLSVTLKALNFLEQKMDKRFDELKENNTACINRLQKELHSVKKEFNDRLDGLSKKVEAKVTDTVLKNMSQRIKTVKTDLRKDITRELSKELSKNDDVERLKRNVEDLQETVDDVITRTTNTRATEGISLNIAIRNLPESENENTLNKVNALIKDGLHLRHIMCKSAIRKQARSDSQHGVVIATCESLDIKKEIMKNKSKLMATRSYERVFIEHDRPKSERNQISNLRTLVNAVGRDRLRVQGSRLVFTQQDDNRNTRERDYSDRYWKNSRNSRDTGNRDHSRRNFHSDQETEDRGYSRQHDGRRENDRRRPSSRYNQDSSRERHSRY